jgi:hypothetical protein
MTTEKINQLIAKNSESGKIKTNEISDGYHTFKELYDHRCNLFILSCKLLLKNNPNAKVWKTLTRHDYLQDVGWFLMGINTEEGNQITYNLKIDYWDLCDFAETIRRAPKWDGHTSNDVINRLNTIINSI